MALYNLARMTTATTGTGTITLGSAVAGFLSFASAGVTDGATVTYAIKDGSNSEMGRGTYTSSGTTLTRTVLKSTNSNTAISLSGSAEVVITAAAEDLLKNVGPGGRLTLTAATPVLTTTVAGTATVRYTPYINRFVPLYDGTGFNLHDFGAELTNDLTATSTGDAGPAAATTNSNYDLFVWYNSTAGAYRLSRGPLWTSSTARGTGAGTTELDLVAGVYLNKVAITNGPAAQRGTYVGTVRTNGSSQVEYSLGGTASGGTEAKINIWNAYNRVPVRAGVADSTANWSYASTTWRSSNNSATMRISFVHGLAEDPVSALFAHIITSTSGAPKTGINLDSTSATPGPFQGYVNSGSANIQTTAFYGAYPGIGFHYLQAMEAGNTTVSFFGNGSNLLSGELFA